MRRSAAMSDYKAKMDSAQADANLLSNNITNGYEIRLTECIVIFHPNFKRKEYINPITNRIELECSMTQADFQLHLDGFKKEGK
jgi:hypothetical protein